VSVADADEPLRPERACFLVGTSPLPVLLAAARVRARHLVLLHSDATDALPSTEPIAQRLRELLIEKLAYQGDEIELASCGDPMDSAAVARAYCEIGEHDHLCYVGGTKVMAVTARRLFTGDSASYVLAEPHEEFILDDRAPAALGTPLDLAPQEVARLHGVDAVGIRGRAADVNGRHHARDVVDQKIESVAGGDDAGNELEQVTAFAVDDATAPGAGRALVNQDWRLGDARFETDVVCCIGHRMVLLTCTTQGGAAEHVKLGEARWQARRLGGQHARWALVCLAGRERAENLAARAPDRRQRVFGRDDVSGWLRGDYVSLRTWLNP